MTEGSMAGISPPGSLSEPDEEEPVLDEPLELPLLPLDEPLELPLRLLPLDEFPEELPELVSSPGLVEPLPLEPESSSAEPLLLPDWEPLPEDDEEPEPVPSSGPDPPVAHAWPPVAAVARNMIIHGDRLRSNRITMASAAGTSCVPLECPRVLFD
jgi:hypothetical protein